MQFRQYAGILIFAAGIAVFAFTLVFGDKQMQEVFLFASAVWVAILVGLAVWLT